ncbi:MAG: hypothetical protein QG614_153 [Patescibacteria group bacterium]|nr:hypothetical protein [Patescibacteria group bacterium]
MTNNQLTDKVIEKIYNAAAQRLLREDCLPSEALSEAFRDSFGRKPKFVFLGVNDSGYKVFAREEKYKQVRNECLRKLQNLRRRNVLPRKKILAQEIKRQAEEREVKIMKSEIDRGVDPEALEDIGHSPSLTYFDDLCFPS